MKGIRFQDVLALPKSELYSLLEEMSRASGKDKQELLLKAQKSYAETDARLRQCMGEEAYIELKVLNKNRSARP